MLEERVGQTIRREKSNVALQQKRLAEGEWQVQDTCTANHVQALGSADGRRENNPSCRVSGTPGSTRSEGARTALGGKNTHLCSTRAGETDVRVAR